MVLLRFLGKESQYRSRSDFFHSLNFDCLIDTLRFVTYHCCLQTLQSLSSLTGLLAHSRFRLELALEWAVAVNRRGRCLGSGSLGVPVVPFVDDSPSPAFTAASASLDGVCEFAQHPARRQVVVIPVCVPAPVYPNVARISSELP